MRWPWRKKTSDSQEMLARVVGELRDAVHHLGKAVDKIGDEPTPRGNGTNGTNGEASGTHWVTLPDGRIIRERRSRPRGLA